MLIDYDNIAAICKAFSIKKLHLVGSAARGDDTPESDVDLVVEFGPFESPLHQYMDSKAAFENLFGRKVDLIEEKGIKNPYFRKSLHEDKVLIYEA